MATSHEHDATEVLATSGLPATMTAAELIVMPSVHDALRMAAESVGSIPKSDFNQQQGFAFRGMEAIMAKVGPALHAHGVLGPLPRVLSRDVEIIEVGSNRKPWRLVTLTVEYTFIGPAGDALTVVTVGEGFDPGDKASNKAMTGAAKYALVQALAIGTGHDDADESERPDLSGRSDGAARRTTARPAQERREQRPPSGPAHASAAQMNAIWRLAERLGLDNQQGAARQEQIIGHGAPYTVQEASAIVEALQAEFKERQA